ncbi:putative nuclease HARBI1 [Anopheles moucheti]|uniref:putative nuclease HARBI1 n=1 Tax=Anopheles moucheti TaxID=186751 RepID=UPI0022F04046|nr:putative nuclease HARBI1 [Anopheles moucheti]
MLPAILLMSDPFKSDGDSTDSDEYNLWYGGSPESAGSSDDQETRDAIPSHLNNEWFLKCLNVSRAVFKELYTNLLPVLNEPYKPTAFEKLAATLRYLAKGTCTSDLFAGGYKAMPRKEFQKMFPQTINAIHALIRNKYISLKTHNVEEQREAERYFSEHYPNLSGAALCAIGTHIEIAEPTDEKHLFYYKLGSYSLNALMMCDHKKRIRFVNASFCGAMHDAHLWISSDLDKYFVDEYLDENTSSYVLAKSMFPSKPWIFTPIKNAKPNSREAIFNDQHAKAHAVAEETISLLKNRFRCLLGKPPIPYKPAECVTIIDVCCALHNMCMACKYCK